MHSHSRYPLPNLSLPRAPSDLFLSIFHQNAQSKNIIYSIRLAAEHTASISPEEGSPEIYSHEGRKIQPPYLLIYSLLPSRKGFKVAYTIGCKLSHVCLEMGNQSFCNSSAFDRAASVCLGRRRRKIQQVLIPKSLSPMLNDNKPALCFYSSFV